MLLSDSSTTFYKLLCMSKRIATVVFHGFALAVKLLGVVLECVRKVLDIIDNGIQDGSTTLPSWYFELVDILNVIQESSDKLGEISVSDEFNDIKK